MSTNPLQELGAPPEVLALGPPQRVVDANSINLADPQLVPVYCCLFCAVVFFALGFFVTTRKQPPPPVVLYGVFAGAGAFTAIGAAMAFRHTSGKGGLAGYLVFREGLAYVADGRWTLIRWPDVTALRAPEHWTADGSLHARDGTIIPLHRHFAVRKEFLDEVERPVCQHVYQQARQAVAAGDSFAFGNFAVSQQGLTHGERTLPWAQVAALLLSHGKPAEAKVNFGDLFASGLRAWVLLADCTIWCHEPYDAIPTRAVLFKMVQTMAPRVALNFTLDEASFTDLGPDEFSGVGRG